ncbi:MAG: hypothetical protein HFE81_07040 [Bacilli bacterium]|nr:hypothetical protein [Bacilli bacterium]
MNLYLRLFIDLYEPKFLEKYKKTKTIERLKYVTQFCGCDYTKLYNPRFLYTRYHHSLVVAHMTWHFTKNKKETIIALLHDAGTPCFAHCIDCVFGDCINQESSERKISDIIKQDKEIMEYLQEDGITLADVDDFSNYHILENKSPNLCADRLDGVLHTGYIWLQKNTLNQIEEVYNNLEVLTNEFGLPEIGFQDLEPAEQFVDMVYHYAKELQGNKDKYVMMYISELVKLSFERGLLNLEDLYQKKEADICNLFATNFSSWTDFKEAQSIIVQEEIPEENFYISFDIKKRNTIPLVKTNTGSKRIIDLSMIAKEKYQNLEDYHDKSYAYVKKIKEII